MSPPLRIVKVGGSLFSRDDLGQRLGRWLGQQPAATNVLIAGGGLLADAVRQWNRRFGFGQDRSHWLCIDLLDATAQVLQFVLGRVQVNSRIVRSVNEINATPSEVLIFAPAHFLCVEELALPGEKLPISWDTTSDSIAARLAAVTKAAELVLLKSSLPPQVQGLTELAGNYVDAQFPSASRPVERIRFVNLSDDELSEWP